MDNGTQRTVKKLQKNTIKKKEENQKIIRNSRCIWYYWNPQISRLSRKTSLNIVDMCTPYRIFSTLWPVWSFENIKQIIPVFCSRPCSSSHFIQNKKQSSYEAVHNRSQPISDLFSPTIQHPHSLFFSGTGLPDISQIYQVPFCLNNSYSSLLILKLYQVLESTRWLIK